MRLALDLGQARIRSTPARPKPGTSTTHAAGQRGSRERDFGAAWGSRISSLTGAGVRYLAMPGNSRVAARAAPDRPGGRARRHHLHTRTKGRRGVTIKRRPSPSDAPAPVWRCPNVARDVPRGMARCDASGPAPGTRCEPDHEQTALGAINSSIVQCHAPAPISPRRTRRALRQFLVKTALVKLRHGLALQLVAFV